jgi:hypothetical protein
MEFSRVLVWLALGLTALCPAASAQDRERIAAGFDDITAGKMRADLFFLASDAMQGRMSLERGDDVAIQWIVSEFTKAGLKPLVGDSYLQPVPLIEYKMDRARTGLTIRTQGTVREFRDLTSPGTIPMTERGRVGWCLPASVSRRRN